jgi:predicted secreted hydrolase
MLSALRGKNKMPDKRRNAGMRWQAALSLLFCLVYAVISHPRSAIQQPDLSADWREASPAYEFSFPRDHAAHPDNRIEWWYYTGNLETKSGRRFGYQLTFFRLGVLREPGNASRWALRDLYMTHFAISDIERRSFHSFERINRAGIGWAGAEVVNRNASVQELLRLPFAVRVWNEDWEARIEDGTHTLRANEEGFELDLTLMPSKPEVVHGENGLSQKGAAGGNASHYYSLTRLESAGRIVVDGESFDVAGHSWMDHEFGTSFLEDQQVGWDWFSIQLEDGRDLMLFQIRRGDGSIDPRSSGTLIEPNGAATHLSYEEFSLAPGTTWRSPKSGASYPTVWEIALNRYGMRLNVSAAFEDQELRTPESTGVTYWEGSVAIEGESSNKRIRGRGYLEMTGYSGESMGTILR